MGQKRRVFLWSLSAAAAGLAGCTGQPSDSAQTTADRTSSPTDASGTTPEPTTTPERQFVHGGDTIPSWPDDDSLDILPLVAGPSREADNPVDGRRGDRLRRRRLRRRPVHGRRGGRVAMFFEIVNHDRTPDAPIGHATSSDGLTWEYNQVVLTKEHHTSFPLVWKDDGEYYICPPTGKRVELWKADDFPTEWSKVGNTIDVDFYSHDPVSFRHGSRWWLAADGLDSFASAVHE
jgi:hypothetical protein